MHFFKKKKGDLDLDLPPPPKPGSEMTKPKEKTKELEPAPHQLKKNEAKDKFPHIHDIKDLEKDLPPLPDLEELEKELPPLRKMGKEELPKLKYPEIEHEKEPEQISAGPIEKPELTQDEKPMLKGPVFVGVGSYKNALSDIILIRSKIKESEDSLKRLNEIKNSKDKYFEQFRFKLEDLQRKSVYVDKNLFEGGMSNE
ncbi:hypothetical protein CEE44_03000 [Candidatus Woesearchaeota archaeon B3_Woes]|nr:MAG: hypothetical protein CEE44_03000 [Candidatus Woesearchaeota archaeon B3_Woes]